MLNLRCLYCQTPFTFSRLEMLKALIYVNERNQNHYDVHCPKCNRANSISRQRMGLFYPNWRNDVGKPEMEKPNQDLQTPIRTSSISAKKPIANKQVAKKPVAKKNINTIKPQKTLKVFICHSSNDKPIVRKLYQRLSREKWIDPWLDEVKLDLGDKWDAEIKKAVKKSDIVIVCISRSSVSKEGFVQKEITFALDIADEKPEGTIFIIPMKLEKCDVPDRLSGWQWGNYYEKDSYIKLLRSLKKRAESLGINCE